MSSNARRHLLLAFGDTVRRVDIAGGTSDDRDEHEPLLPRSTICRAARLHASLYHWLSNILSIDSFLCAATSWRVQKESLRLAAS
jgi:hypothetical protein